MPSFTQYFELYRNIAVALLTESMTERSQQGEHALKDMLFRLVGALQVSNKHMR